MDTEELQTLTDEMLITLKPYRDKMISLYGEEIAFNHTLAVLLAGIYALNPEDIKKLYYKMFIDKE